MDVIRYEHPLNERIRTLMRLEDLYGRALFFTGETAPADHHAALLALFEIVDVAARADLKTDILQELERQRQLLAPLKHNPAIDGKPKDQYDNYVAISTKCAHLGCPVRYIEASQRFVCPCHGGVYDFSGRRTGGPPVRPLDRFYTREMAGRLQIGPRFSVNSELRRFSPRDPAEPLDGIGQYLYPRRFDTTNKPPGAKN